MKSFKTFLLENNLSVILEYKEWHQTVKQFGDKIIDQFKLGYKPPSTSEKDTIPHKTEFIKTQLGLHDIPKHHGRWILNQVVRGKIPNREDIASTIIPNLAKFEEHKDRHNINLSKVNDRTELFNIVQKHAPEESDSLNLKQGEDYTLHGENEHWKVVEPHNEKSACAFGSNTNWCTASKDNSVFEQYSKHGPLHILIPKKPLYKGEKYQYHRASNQFMNHEDTPVNADDGKQLSLIDRPLPEIDENLKFDLKFNASISNKDTSKKDLLKLIKHPKFGSAPGHITTALRSRHESVAKAVVAHPSFGSADDITSALRSRHESVAKAAVAHPSFGRNYFDIPNALHSSYESVAKAAFEHPIFGSANDITVALRSPHESIVNAAVADPIFGSDPGHITSALHSSHESVAKAAVAHPSFGSDPGHITTALFSHESVAKAAVAHPSFGSAPGHITSALRSSHESVAKAAVAHPSFGSDPEHLRNALNSDHESVAKAAREYQSKTKQNTVNESLFMTINKIVLN